MQGTDFDPGLKPIPAAQTSYETGGFHWSQLSPVSHMNTILLYLIKRHGSSAKLLNNLFPFHAGICRSKLNPNFPLQNAYSYPLATHIHPFPYPNPPSCFILICGHFSSISSCLFIYLQKYTPVSPSRVFMSIYLFLMVGRGLHSSLTIWCIMTLFGYCGVFCEYPLLQS